MYTQTVTTTDADGHVATIVSAPDRDIRDAHVHFDTDVAQLRTDLTKNESPIAAGHLTSYSIVTVEDVDVLAMETGFFRAELDMWCIVTMGASHDGDLTPTIKYGAYGVHFNDVPDNL